jgi:hypothetical protein
MTWVEIAGLYVHLSDCKYSIILTAAEARERAAELLAAADRLEASWQG